MKKISHKNNHSPVKTAQPAAAASDILWPAKPGKKEPPITATADKLYKHLSSPTYEFRKYMKASVVHGGKTERICGKRKKN